MSLLRFVAILALGVWLGGLVALGGVAAPVLFDVLELRDGAAGRELAGLLFGSIFGQFQIVSWVMGGLVLLSLGLRAALGPRPQHTALRIWTVVAMLGLSVVTSMVFIPRIDAIRQDAGGAVNALAATDPRRIEFGRLHGLSNGLALVILIGGLALVWSEMRDQH